MNMLEKIKYSSDYLKKMYSKKIDIAVILGTGLGSIVDEIENKVVIQYKDIPEFPTSTVQGHAGEIIIGNISGKNILAMNGRFHYYEGYHMDQVTFGVRVIKALGIDNIIITNAAGGMNPNFSAGDLMIIEDHINLTGNNPLIGHNFEELGPRFPDMSNAYTRGFVDLISKCAEDLNIKVQKGTYVAVSGPTYETPAELKMLRIIGGDAVGMSTVPEVIVASHAGMKVLGVSCITDMALPDSLEPLDHEKVMDTAEKAKVQFISLIKEVIKRI
ncbi:MAG: purine-nucleoside phosphorylase [Bacillota bacterium]|nr:purine-nucleoside phosphorylase [Bacillota bacterium]